MKKSFLHIALSNFILLYISCHPAFSQELTNTRTKHFQVSGDTLHIDSLSIIPGSVSVNNASSGTLINPADYRLDEFKSTLYWRSKSMPDSIEINYRVFPYLFTKETYHKDFSLLNKQDSLSRLPIIYSLQELNPSGTLDLGTMDYNGSFSRGVSFGNNQDVVVNSSFNLQMQGKLAGDVEVVAALSDNNIPIQPEGNTQQLQEFDKIFIQLKKKQTALVVGDYELSKPVGYFMNFYKKLQGASFTTGYDGGKNLQLKTAASIAIAKGKYVKNDFLGQEGNQGPYRLTGSNGETFIIILAGTERVYIDGLLMVRGSDRDYIIDYNAGEIIFTTNRLITKDKRISVEFQYSEKAYLRTIFFAGQQFQQDNWNLHVNFYSEQDSKNQPAQQELSDSQKIILSEAGDSIQNAYYQSIDSVGFIPDRILYKKIDSLGFTVYVYSINPDSAKYALNFSYVGSGNGNYVIANTLVNGRVYKWLAPQNGLPQGDYEPVIPLIPPQSIQLLTLGADYKMNQNSTITVEGALSNKDINTFSDESNADNDGISAHVGFDQKINLNHNQEHPANFFINAQYEFASLTFKPIERYRPVEFERDWNISGIPAAANEHLGIVNLNLDQTGKGNLNYMFSVYNRTGSYTGFNNALNGNYENHGFHAAIISSYLVSNSDLQHTRFLRPTVDISQSLNFLRGAVIGVRGEQENNRIFSDQGDTLLLSSFYWNQGKIYLKSNDTAKTKLGADFTSRIDYTPTGDQFRKAAVGNTAEFSAEFLGNPASILRLNLAYRMLNVEDTSLTPIRPDESLLGRIGYDLQIKKGFIVSNALYEIGSVQEQKKEFAYAPVPDGTGVYTWIDYNEDGIQQINEFEIAAFQSDADYIKVLLPTNEFVKAYSTLFNESLSINPKSLLNSKEGVGGFVSRFSVLATLQINKKTLSGNFESQFNPFLLNVADSLLLSEGSLISGSLYFNKTNPKYGIDFTYQNNRNKTLLTNGVEFRTILDYGIRFRWNISRRFSSIVRLNQNDKGYAAEFFPQNDYQVRGYIAEPQFTYQPSNVFRLALTYRYSNSKNEIGESGEKALNNKVALDVKYNVIAKSVINVNAAYANVDYNGPANTPVQYAMLDGLQTGQNYLLTISFDRKLSGFIELSLSYEGRKTGDSPLVNIGRAQVRALF